MQSENQELKKAALQALLDHCEDTTDYQIALLEAYGAYAESLMKPPCDFDGALVPAKKALEIAKQNYDAHQSEEAALQLANCYQRLTVCSMNLQQFEAADDYGFHVLTLLYDMVEKQATFGCVYNLVIAHLTMAKAAEGLRDTGKACLHYQMATNHMETLLPYDSTPPLLHQAAQLYFDYGACLKGNQDYTDESIDAYRRSVVLFEDLCHADHTRENANSLGDACRALAAQLDQRGDHAEADTLYKKSFEVMEAFADPEKQKNLEMIKAMLQNMIDQDMEEAEDDE